MQDLDQSWRLNPGLSVYLYRDSLLTQDGDFDHSTLQDKTKIIMNILTLGNLICFLTQGTLFRGKNTKNGDFDYAKLEEEKKRLSKC